MSRHNGKTPYYHPDEKNHMLNQIGEMDRNGNIIDDGYSFDEYDDDDLDSVEEKSSTERTSDGRRLYELNGKRYSFRVGSYPSDPMVMSIRMETEAGEPYATLSKNFGNFVGNDEYTGSFIRDNCTFIDTNNNHGIEKTLESLGAQPYTRWGSAVTMDSGFCSYPLYEFPNNVLQDMDPKGYEQHMNTYKTELPKEMRKLQAGSYGMDDFEAENGYEC